MKVVLLNPDIPQNTGNIGRTCLANNIELILVGKLGFEIDDKHLKRAGLDYWKHVKFKIYKDFDEFLNSEIKNEDQLLFFSTHGKKTIWEAKYLLDSYLIFGSETKGFDKFIYEKYQQRLYKIPMENNLVRSLNLATSAGIVIYTALYFLNFKKT